MFYSFEIEGHDVFTLWLRNGSGVDRLWGVYSNAKAAHDDGQILVKRFEEMLGGEFHYRVSDWTVRGESYFY